MRQAAGAVTVAEPAAPTLKRPLAGVLAAATGVVLWGCLVPLAKAADDVNGIVLGFHRLWIGSFAVLGVFYGTGGRLSKAGLRTSCRGGILFGLDIIFFFSAPEADHGRERDHRRGAAARPAALRGRPLVRRAGERGADRPHRRGHRRRRPRGHRLGVGQRRRVEPARRRVRAAGAGVVDGVLHRLQAGPGDAQLARVPGVLPRDRIGDGPAHRPDGSRPLRPRRRGLVDRDRRRRAVGRRRALPHELRPPPHPALPGQPADPGRPR